MRKWVPLPRVLHAGLLSALLSGGTLGCASAPPIERRQGQQIYLGRSISPEAYASYARGLRLASERRWEEARQAFEETLHADPQSGSAWAALGQLYCEYHPALASQIFLEGRERAQELHPIYLAQGFCALSQKDAELAYQSAQEALTEAPLHPRTTELLEASLLALERPQEAQMVRTAWQLLTPAPLTQSTLEYELASGDLAEHELWLACEPTLRTGSLPAVQAACVGLLSPAELSLHLLALGRDELAQEQALLTLASSPEDPLAQLVALLSAGAPAGATLALPHTAAPALAPEHRPLSLLLTAEYLLRWVGSSSSQAFLERSLPLSFSSPLEERVARRLLQRLSLAHIQLTELGDQLLLQYAHDLPSSKP